jgi:diamine N-acetyltransferase
LTAVDGTPELLLRGEKVGLGPLRKDLLAHYARWMNDPAVKRGTGSLGIQTPESEEAWYEGVVAACAGRRPASAHFTVHELERGEPVGTTSLMGIDPMARTARFGIVIGAGQGQGFGTEATRLTLDWGFHVLALRNVLLEVLPWNTGAIRAYEKAGFRHVGVRRNSAFHLAERSDEVLMDAIPEEFESPVLGRR